LPFCPARASSYKQLAVMIGCLVSAGALIQPALLVEQFRELNHLTMTEVNHLTMMQVNHLTMT
jgi:hypothetical protein